MKADLIRLAVVPYFVLLLLICNWNVKLYGACNSDDLSASPYARGKKHPQRQRDNGH